MKIGICFGISRELSIFRDLKTIWTVKILSLIEIFVDKLKIRMTDETRST